VTLKKACYQASNNPGKNGAKNLISDYSLLERWAGLPDFSWSKHAKLEKKYTK
jgi:hypothetical protein